jgi:hypothetical protein
MHLVSPFAGINVPIIIVNTPSLLVRKASANDIRKAEWTEHKRVCDHCWRRLIQAKCTISEAQMARDLTWRGSSGALVAQFGYLACEPPDLISKLFQRPITAGENSTHPPEGDHPAIGIDYSEPLNLMNRAHPRRWFDGLQTLD